MINDPPGMNRPDWITMEAYLKIIKDSLDGTTSASFTDSELRSLPIEVKVIEEIDSLDYNQDSLVDLRYAMDKKHQMPLYTEVANPGKRDQFGAAIPSDAPVAFEWTSVNALQAFVVDTTGYQSVVIQKSTAGIITTTASNDGQTWYAVVGYLSSTPQSPVTSMPAALGIYIFPVTARYFRLVGPASAVQCTIYLRATPHRDNFVSNNITQVAGTAIVTGGLAGTQAIGGNVATGAAPTTNPIQIGGVDAGRLVTPNNVAANLTPKTRRALVDEQGRFIPPNVDLVLNGNQNIYGTATANVRDVDQAEGQSQTELMWQILVELKMLNHQIHEMAGGSLMQGDDIEMLRTNFSMYKYNT